MNAAPERNHILEAPARVLVSTVRVSVRHRLLMSCLGLLLAFLVGGGYLLIGALKVDPLASDYRVRVELTQSGGLLPGQDVTVRGLRVGRVRSVEADGDKVVAVATIDSDTRIPAAGRVRVATLSLAGEQYLDFLPSGEGGPYLSDGDVVASERTSTPTTLTTMLGSLNGTLRQIDPEKFRAVMQELGVSSAGPSKLAAIIDGGMFMVSTLDSVLPQTVSLLHNSKTVLLTLSDVSPGLVQTSNNLSKTLGGVEAMTGGFETLVGNAPGALRTVDQIIADNSPTMVQLLGNLAITSQMAYLHVPALQEFFFPQQRAGSALGAITSVFHDGYIWGLANIYPQYACDYGVPHRPGTQADFPEPYLNAECANPDPSVLIRGARNAPRPPGDNTAYAPPGSDPLATTDPSPVGPVTIPTPYGGLDAPHYVPRK